MSFAYIASPYTHIQHNVMIGRYNKVGKLTAYYLNSGESVYSPIVHCHELAVSYGLPRDFNFWKKYNEDMLGAASALYVFMLDGWEESTGVQGEIQFAKEKDIPIVYVSEES